VHAQQTVRQQPYAIEHENQERKGGARGGAQGSSAAGSCGSEKSSGPARRRASGRGGRAQRPKSRAALGIEGAQGAMRRPGAFAQGVIARVFLACRAADLGGQRRDARPGVSRSAPGSVEGDARESEPGGDTGAMRAHGRFFSTDAGAFPAVNLRGSGILHSDMKGRLEDRRLLTGQGRFISDWNFSESRPTRRSCARTARTPRSSPSTREARSKPPGVLAVLTARTWPKPATSRFRPTSASRTGSASRSKNRRTRCSLKGKSPRRRVRRLRRRRVAAARAGRAELIAVEYRELPAVTSWKG